MILKKILLQSFRNFNRTEIVFKDNITTIVGPNDSGKSNLLQAIYYIMNPKLLQDEDVCYFSTTFTDNKIPSIIYHLDVSLLKLNYEIKPKELKIKLENKKLNPVNNIVRLQYDIRINNNKKIPFKGVPEKEIINHYYPYKYSRVSSVKDDWERKESIFLEKVDSVNAEILCQALEEKDLKYSKNKNHTDVTKDIFNQILGKLSVIFWEYKMENVKIKTEYSIKSLMKNPNSEPLINLLFKKLGIDLKQFFNYDEDRKNNILATLNKLISDLIGSNWTQNNIEFRFQILPNNTLRFNVFENGKIIDLKKHGDGFKWFFLFFLDFSEEFSPEFKNKIILLDEPGNYLHPGAQRLLLNQFEKLARSNQIIYTTHSPFMVNRIYPKRVIFIDRENGETIIQIPTINETFDDVLLSSTLGFTFTNITRWGDIIVFVEGLTDQVLFENLILKYAEYFKEEILDLNLYSFINIAGLANLDNFLTLAITTNSKFIVFLDNDDEAKEKTKKYSQSFNKRAKIHKNTIDHIIFLEEKKTIEDYIPISLLNQSVKNLSNSTDVVFQNCLRDYKFKDELRKPQINDLITQFKDFISKNIDKIKEISKTAYTKNNFKFLLFTKIIELIDESNIKSFENLINKIEEIQEIYKELYD